MGALSWAKPCAPVYAEDFQDMAQWRPFNLPGVDAPSSFSVEERVLRIRSHDAASGLLWDEVLDMSRVVSLSWRVRITQMPGETDLASRAADDSPLRLLLIFSDDREELAGLGPDPDDDSLPLLSLIRGRVAGDLLLYGAVAGETVVEGGFHPSSVSDAIMVVPWLAELLSGESWQELRVLPEEDFLRAFGKPRPRWARFALITDTDDMKGRAAVSLDKLELCGE